MLLLAGGALYATHRHLHLGVPEFSSYTTRKLRKDPRESLNTIKCLRFPAYPSRLMGVVGQQGFDFRSKSKYQTRFSQRTSSGSIPCRISFEPPLGALSKGTIYFIQKISENHIFAQNLQLLGLIRNPVGPAAGGDCWKQHRN